MILRILLVSMIGLGMGAGWLVGGATARAILDVDPATPEVELVPEPDCDGNGPLPDRYPRPRTNWGLA